MYGYNLYQLCARPVVEPGSEVEDFERRICQLYPELLAHLKCWIVANPGKMITNDRSTVQYKEDVEKRMVPPMLTMSEEDRDFFLAQCDL